MKREFFVTEDGSHTFYIPEINEHYHSTHGAIQESNHVFIEAGFRQIDLPEINILEIGLGTGLNVLLSLVETKKTGQKINYVGIEKYPIQPAEYKHLNYTEGEYINYKPAFLKLHNSEWESPIVLSPTFCLTKIKTDLNFIEFQQLPLFNLVYFDAFAPNKQEGIWTEANFKRIYDNCAHNAILVTYCAQGNVRRTLQSVGFMVERIPGPPGKREMIRAIK